MALATRAGPMGPQLLKVFSIQGLTPGAGAQSMVVQLSHFSRGVIWIRGINDSGGTVLTLTLSAVVSEDAATPPGAGDKVAYNIPGLFTTKNQLKRVEATTGGGTPIILSGKVEFSLVATVGKTIDAEVWIELFP